MTETALVRPRYGLVARLLMVGLLSGLAIFFAAMSVLVSHDSFLECRSGASCKHVERYPLGVVNETSLSAITRADVRWDTGGRRAALKLVLHHADGTRTDYSGVGKNGERAEDVAAAMNSFFAGNEPARSFQLRGGSLAIAVLLLLVAVAGLLLVPHFFTKVRLARSKDAVISVTTGRWPAKTVRHQLPLAEFARVGLEEKFVDGRQFVSLRLERTSGPPVDLGLSFNSMDGALREQEVIASLLR